MNILVTGGAGYIGSHVVEELQKSGFTPIVYDNFSTGHEAAVPDEVQLVEGDIHDVRFAKHIMEQFKIDAVIHFAASSLVGESMTDPAKYYFNNVEGSLHLVVPVWTAWYFLLPQLFTVSRKQYLLPRTAVWHRPTFTAVPSWQLKACWRIMIMPMICVM